MSRGLMIGCGVGLIAAGLVALIFVPSDWALLALLGCGAPGLLLFVLGQLKPRSRRGPRR